MKELRELFGALGFSEVQTYLPSGNVVLAQTPPAGESVEFALVGDEIHLQVPDGYGRTKASGSLLG
ncbi:DUF1697 domain-containing protein [Streptomyces achromogenes]|uniref:DUF1697 domain-containing protein n=1 Tax=Streptomyces achromogenes TaxID=67255 RepID=UPI0034156B4B